MKKRRIERDVLGELEVPEDAYWGISTQRAIENFSISSQKMPKEFLHALAIVKKACTLANMELGVLDKELGEAILEAIDDILHEKKFYDQFPVDIYQTGSGTQTNMNMNEVIANRANEILGYPKGKKQPVHPNDHVNRSQSSNDVIPTAMHISVLETLSKDLQPAVEHLLNTLDSKIREFEGIIKVGRTHLQDAVPIPLSTEFRVYHHHILSTFNDIQNLWDDLAHLPIGGTAVGTGINTPAHFDELVVENLAKLTYFPLKPLLIKASAIASHNVFVRLSGALRALAMACLKMANDIRWMGSGPRTGLGELLLPTNEPGSSIMPGKINPTQAESLIQVCLRVFGNDLTISFGESFGSNLDLNVAKPLIAATILESIRILSNGIRSFADKCLLRLIPNVSRIENQLEHNLMIITRLTPVIGYDKASEIAIQAQSTGKSIREVVEEMALEIENLDELLDPHSMV